MTEDQELELFTIKSKFFREIPHPKLILKAMIQVSKMPGFFPDRNETTFDPDMELEPMLQMHSDRIYTLKGDISKAAQPADLYHTLSELYAWHQALLAKLVDYLPVRESWPDTEIKQSDPIDSYSLLQFIRSSGLAENQIKAYICNEIETGEPAQFSLLTRVCLQARKINANVRSGESS